MKLNLPNTLSLSRIFLVPVLVVIILTKFQGKVYLGVAVYVIASVTDWLDGYLARRNKQVTTLGALLDPIADKLLNLSAFIAFVEVELAPAWMVVIIVGRDIAVQGLRVIAASQGITIAASPLGKAKMISQVSCIIALIIIQGKKLVELAFIGDIMLWAVLLIALASGLDYYLRFSKNIDLTGTIGKRSNGAEKKVNQEQSQG